MQTKEQIREYNRLWARRKAVKHRVLGLCHDCNNPAVPGKNYCEKCISRWKGRDLKAYLAARRENRKKLGICQECDNVAEKGFTLCPQCNSRHREVISRRKRERIAEGKCRSCNNIPTKGYKTCEACRVLARKYQLDYKNRHAK